MKIAPIIHALEAHRKDGGALRYRLVHTGQHYDARMSGDFFTQLGIPEPHVNLEVGSGTQAEQTATIMVRYENLLLEARSDVCLVVGDGCGQGGGPHRLIGEQAVVDGGVQQQAPGGREQFGALRAGQQLHPPRPGGGGRLECGACPAAAGHPG